MEGGKPEKMVGWLQVNDQQQVVAQVNITYFIGEKADFKK